MEYPILYKEWFTFSKAITLLAVKNEDELKFLIKQLTEKNIPLSIFIEPDINNQVTAITIAPSLEAKKICSSIPLALKEYNKPKQIHKHYSGHSNGQEDVVSCN
jgi:hypothetical protein